MHDGYVDAPLVYAHVKSLYHNTGMSVFDFVVVVVVAFIITAVSVAT